MQIINFSHPLSAQQLEALLPLLDGQTIASIRDVRCQLNNEASFADQARALVDAVEWTAHQWQHNRFILVAPALSAAALAVVAEIHGRCGYFPALLRLKPVGGAPPVFMPAEILDLSGIRELARSKR